AGKSADDTVEAADDDEKPVHVTIDFAKLDQRILAFDIPPGDYQNLVSGGDGLLYYLEHKLGEPDFTLHQYDMEEREDRTLLEGIDQFAISADGEKLLYHAEETWGIVKTSDSPKVGDGALATTSIRMLAEPRAEWRQIFNEAWRFHRDYFYD